MQTEEIHDGGRNANDEDILHRLPVETEALMRQTQFPIFPLIQDETGGAAHNLTNNRRNRRTGDTHLAAENQNRVKDDVRHRAGQLGNHRQRCVARRLHHAFKADGHELPQAERADDAQVQRAHFQHFRLRVRHANIHAGEEQPDDNEQQPADDLNQDAVAGGIARIMRALFAKPA